MKIVVMGSGNIGSLLGALLTEAGQDVTLVDIREDLVAALKKDGLKINVTNGVKKQIKVKAATSVSSTGKADLVMITTKGFATRAAMESAMPVVSKDTYILSVQNGAGNIETIAGITGDESHVICGTFHNNVYFTSINELTWVWASGGLIKMAPMNGQMNPMITEMSEIFQKIGLKVLTLNQAQELIWNKMMYSVDMPVAALLNMTNDEFGYYSTVPQIVSMLVDECLKVAKAKGVNMGEYFPPGNKSRFTDSAPIKCSMYQDIINNRRTEVDSTNGAVVREGQKYNIPTPANQMMFLFVKALEEKAAKNKGK